MASRTELKAKFSAGQSIKESDFHTLIESLAHLTDDVASGELATGQEVSSIRATMQQLSDLASMNSKEIENLEDSMVANWELNELRANLEGQINTGISSVTATQAANNAEQKADIDDLKSRVPAVESDVSDIKVSLAQGIYELKRDYVSKTYYDGQETYLEGYIESKADKDHTHEEYIEESDIADLVDSNDLTLRLSDYAETDHFHSAAEISGLNTLFMTPAEVQQLIQDNKVTLDQNFSIADEYYSKEEVEEKFYVARWRTDQVSLFTPSVVSISQPLVDLAKEEVKVSISNVRSEIQSEVDTINSEFEAVRSELTGVRNECMVSIGVTNNTVAQNKTASEQADITLQGNIDLTAQNASASIASSQTHVLEQLASVRAEVIEDIEGNDEDITALQNRATSLESRATNLESKDTSLDADIAGIRVSISNTNANVIQTLSDAKAYTDTEINELLNGAGEAYDTLKELQDHITSNESSAAEALTAQVTQLQTQITNNDTDISSLDGRATNLETRATNLEAKDTSLDEDIVGLQTQITSNDTDITALQGRATNLETRATSLEEKDVSLDTDIAGLTSSLALLQTKYDTLLASNESLLESYNTLVEKVNLIESYAYTPYHPGSYANVGYVFP